MKISYSLAILNITNSFLLTNMPALHLIALTQMLIVFSNVCCSAYKLICFSYCVVIVRAQINISTEDTDFQLSSLYTHIQVRNGLLTLVRKARAAS